MKTMTAWETKVGQRVRVLYNGKYYEMVVEWLKRHEEDCTISLWGSSVLSGIGASEMVILIDEENCEFWQNQNVKMEV